MIIQDKLSKKMKLILIFKVIVFSESDKRTLKLIKEYANYNCFFTQLHAYMQREKYKK